MVEVDVPGLELCKRVLAKVLRQREARLLFRGDIDYRSLGLPADVRSIQKTINLAVIYDKLEASQRVAWKDSQITQPAQVWSDVQGVLNTCSKFSESREYATLREHCSKLRTYFEEQWRKAGLQPGTSQIELDTAAGINQEWKEETEIPSEFSYQQDGADLPLRLLQDFSVVFAHDAKELASIDAQPSDTRPRLVRGAVLKPDNETSVNAGDAPKVLVQTGPLLDWCIEYGASGGIWAITQHAWYKLWTPAPEYQDMFGTTCKKYQLAAASAAVLDSDPTLAYQAALAKVLVAGDESEPYTEVDVRQESTFLAGQMDSYWKSSAGGTMGAPGKGPGKEPSLLQRLKEWGQPVQKKLTLLSSPAATAAGAKRAAAKQGPGQSGTKLVLSPQAAVVTQPDAGTEQQDDGEEKPKEKRARTMAGLPGARARSRAPPLKQEIVDNGLDPMATNGIVSPRRLTLKLKPSVLKGTEAVPPAAAELGERSKPAVVEPETMAVSPAAVQEGKRPSRSSRKGSRLQFAEAVVEPARATPQSGRGRGRGRGRAAPTVIAESTPSSEVEVADDDVEESPHFPAPKRRKKSMIGTEAPTRAPKPEPRKAAATAAARQQRQLLLAEQRLKKQQEQDSARGEPPAPIKSFRVSPDLVPDVLMIWELSQSCGALLQIPPLPLRVLEAALQPGPLKPPSSPLNPPPVMNHSGPHPLPPLPLSDHASLVDPDYAPSGYVLRDLHSGLLRVIEGRPPPKPEKVDKGADKAGSAALTTQPERVNLRMDDFNWMDAIHTCLLTRLPKDLITADVQSALHYLETHDYAQLSAAQRVCLLKCLIELAMDSDQMREFINTRIETLTSGAAGRGKHGDGGEVGEEAGEGGSKAGGGAAAKVEPVPTNDPVEQWMKWIDEHQLSLRRPLGTDFRGRRYWCLGGRSGCWRIFVESADGASWGWYEGPGVIQLLDWIQKGHLEGEVELLEILKAAPLPTMTRPVAKPQVPAVPGQPQATPQVVVEEVVMSGADLEPRQADGYRLIVSPILRTARNDANPKMGVEERILQCVDALIGCVDFWKKPRTWLNKVCNLFDTLKSWRNGMEVARCVVTMQNWLIEEGLMKAEWKQHWQGPWIRSMSRQGLSMADVAMHLATLQQFVVEAETARHRIAFMNMAQEMRCPLYFPKVGDTIMLFRTGCQLHLQKYLAPEDDPLTSPIPQLNAAKPEEDIATKVAAVSDASQPGTVPETVKLEQAGTRRADEVAVEKGGGLTLHASQQPVTATQPKPTDTSTPDMPMVDAVTDDKPAEANKESAPSVTVVSTTTDSSPPQAGKPHVVPSISALTDAKPPHTKEATPAVPSANTSTDAKIPEPVKEATPVVPSTDAKIADPSKESTPGVPSANTSTDAKPPEPNKDSTPAVKPEVQDSKTDVTQAAKPGASSAAPTHPPPAAPETAGANHTPAQHTAATGNLPATGPDTVVTTPADHAATSADTSKNPPAAISTPGCAPVSVSTPASNAAVDGSCQPTMNVSNSITGGPATKSVITAPVTAVVDTAGSLPGDRLQGLAAAASAEGGMRLAVSGGSDASEKFVAAGRKVHRPDLQYVLEQINQLHPVEKFKVVSIAYRSYPSGGPYWLSCLWLLLQPIKGGPRASQAPFEVAAPIHIDLTAADYVVEDGMYTKATAKLWKSGDRFRMLFGATKQGNKLSGGMYYRGTVVHVRTPDGVGDRDFDPWESVLVEWDSGDTGGQKLNPWEFEEDPEERRRLLEEKRKEQEAAARKARQAEKEKRAARRAARRDGGRSDDGSNDEEEDTTIKPPIPSGPNIISSTTIPIHLAMHPGNITHQRPAAPSIQLPVPPPNTTSALSPTPGLRLIIKAPPGMQPARPSLTVPLPQGTPQPTSQAMPAYIAPTQGMRPSTSPSGAAHPTLTLNIPVSGSQPLASTVTCPPTHGSTFPKLTIVPPRGPHPVIVATTPPATQAATNVIPVGTPATMPLRLSIPSPGVLQLRGNDGPVRADLLKTLPDKEGFCNMLWNYHNRIDSRFKKPVFSGQELDLLKLFLEVQSRGGYERATSQKVWKDICRSLSLDLSGQTSASYNIRVNYEKSLLAFENYMTSGQYEKDMKAGKLPAATSSASDHPWAASAGTPPGPMTQPGGPPPSSTSARPAALSPTLPGIIAPRPPPSGFPPEPTDGNTPPGYATTLDPTVSSLACNPSSSANITSCLPAPCSESLPPGSIPIPSMFLIAPSPVSTTAAPPPACTAGPASGAAPAATAPAPAPAVAPVGGTMAADAKPSSTIPSPAPTVPPSGSHPVLPVHVQLRDPNSERLSPVQLEGALAYTMLSQPTVPDLSNPIAEPIERVSLGSVLGRMGLALLAAHVWRNWPEHGGWFSAEVTAFNSETYKHCLTYDRGKEEETFEWVNLWEMDMQDLLQYPPSSQHPRPSCSTDDGTDYPEAFDTDFTSPSALPQANAAVSSVTPPPTSTGLIPTPQTLHFPGPAVALASSLQANRPPGFPDLNGPLSSVPDYAAMVTPMTHPTLPGHTSGMQLITSSQGTTIAPVNLFNPPGLLHPLLPTSHIFSPMQQIQPPKPVYTHSFLPSPAFPPSPPHDPSPASRNVLPSSAAFNHQPMPGPSGVIPAVGTIAVHAGLMPTLASPMSQVPTPGVAPFATATSPVAMASTPTAPVQPTVLSMLSAALQSGMTPEQLKEWVDLAAKGEVAQPPAPPLASIHIPLPVPVQLTPQAPVQVLAQPPARPLAPAPAHSPGQPYTIGQAALGASQHPALQQNTTAPGVPPTVLLPEGMASVEAGGVVVLETAGSMMGLLMDEPTDTDGTAGHGEKLPHNTPADGAAGEMRGGVERSNEFQSLMAEEAGIPDIHAAGGINAPSSAVGVIAGVSGVIPSAESLPDGTVGVAGVSIAEGVPAAGRPPALAGGSGDGAHVDMQHAPADPSDVPPEVQPEILPAAGADPTAVPCMIPAAVQVGVQGMVAAGNGQGLGVDLQNGEGVPLVGDVLDGLGAGCSFSQLLEDEEDVNAGNNGQGALGHVVQGAEPHSVGTNSESAAPMMVAHGSAAGAAQADTAGTVIKGPQANPILEPAASGTGAMLAQADLVKDGAGLVSDAPAGTLQLANGGSKVAGEQLLTECGESGIGKDLVSGRGESGMEKELVTDGELGIEKELVTVHGESGTEKDLVAGGGESGTEKDLVTGAAKSGIGKDAVTVVGEVGTGGKPSAPGATGLAVVGESLGPGTPPPDAPTSVQSVVVVDRELGTNPSKGNAVGSKTETSPPGEGVEGEEPGTNLSGRNVEGKEPGANSSGGNMEGTKPEISPLGEVVTGKEPGTHPSGGNVEGTKQRRKLCGRVVEGTKPETSPSGEDVEGKEPGTNPSGGGVAGTKPESSPSGEDVEGKTVGTNPSGGDVEGKEPG